MTNFVADSSYNTCLMSLGMVEFLHDNPTDPTKKML
jgi:hypothetical protein